MTKRPLLLVLAHGIFGWGGQAAGRDMRQDYYTGVRPSLEHRDGNRGELTLTKRAEDVSDPTCVETDDRGAYAIDGLLAARYQVTAMARTYRPARASGSRAGSGTNSRTSCDPT